MGVAAAPVAARHITTPVCQPVTRRQCRTVPVQTPRTVETPVCVNVPKCTSVPKCVTVPHCVAVPNCVSVPKCINVPKCVAVPKCSTTEQCVTVTKPVCNLAPREVPGLSATLSQGPPASPY